MSAELTAWLERIEALHPAEMELGLERVATVAQRLGLLPFPVPVITVAGTNGKGSTLALMEALARAAGRRVALYTSPHLFRFNERIRVDGAEAPDALICEALEQVDMARGDISLTYFEFATLAALSIFAREKPDLCLLEVGLGGRLDAVNIIDPDVAVITSVGLDHTAWLGEDRETIAREKAGIARPGVPMLYGETDMPAVIDALAEQGNIPLWRAGREFGDQGALYWHEDGVRREHRPGDVALGRDNLATALQALALAGVYPEAETIDRAAALRLTGRAQHLARGGVSWYLDVGHNREALVRFLDSLPPAEGRTLAVAAMLMDKPARLALAHFLPVVDHWYLAGLPGRRGAGPEHIREALPERLPAVLVADVAAAVAAAGHDARPGDRVLVFGSFLTVAAAANALDEVS